MISILIAAAGMAELPTAREVGKAVAISQMCVDKDGLTMCDPTQPVGATFRKILCAEYGSDRNNNPIVRCVFQGAKLKMSNSRLKYRDFGDGSIDVIYDGNTWLPSN